MAFATERWRRALLICGILAPVLYVAMTLFVGLLWEGYSVVARVPSELAAIGAPTRALWIGLGMVYAVLMVAFGWIVWTAAPPNKPLRVVGALLMAYTVFGQFWPPMHQRAVLAAGGSTLTDTLHLVWAMITGLFFVLIVGVGAAALGKRFRVYSIVTMAIGLACGAVTGTYASQVQADLPTPWVGLWERISIAAFMAWIAVLSTALLRAPRRAAPAPASTPGRWPRSVRATPQERTRPLPGDELHRCSHEERQEDRHIVGRSVRSHVLRAGLRARALRQPRRPVVKRGCSHATIAPRRTCYRRGNPRVRHVPAVPP
jgi:hypothetical protein